VRHLDEGTLRRLLDEPFAVPMTDRLHVECCPKCKERFETVAADARAVSALFGDASVGEVEVQSLGNVRRESAERRRRDLPAVCSCRPSRIVRCLRAARGE